MNKLYFKYGVMGSSKTAQALMCRFNYLQKGFQVFIFKPKADNRCIVDGKAVIKTRIGLYCDCLEFSPQDNFLDLCKKYSIYGEKSIIIVDEAQFLSREQVNELKIVSRSLPVLCYGLLTNFKTELFEGSKRLVEIADSIQEIKSICRCGRKATINARIINGKIATDGDSIVIGGDEMYEAMCYDCYIDKLERDKKC